MQRRVPLGSEPKKLLHTAVISHTTSSPPSLSQLPLRTDDRWNHLRSVEELRRRVGHIIELPNFPRHLPKGFDRSVAQRVLLTQERFDLVEKIFKAVQLGREASDECTGVGMILSGPYGVSKTVVSYLLMSILYINNAIVVYIVRPLYVM